MSKLADKKLKLPATDFPMRSGLPNLEKRIQAYWKEIDLINLININPNNRCFVTHSGPPYANGNFHIGHGLNIFLKNIIVRIFNFLGYNINNLTGHDCHGLPIELAVIKKIKESKEKITSIDQVIDKCNQFARDYIEIQQNTFERMGLLKSHGYYSTMDSIKQIYEVFVKLIMKDLVFLDKKPCAWSITEKTVISDAEIIYKSKFTKTVDIALEIIDSPIRNMIGQFVCVWTTTPWTLIDNVAVAFNRDHDYLICEVDEKILIIGSEVRQAFEERTEIKLNVLAEVSGTVFENVKCRHPILDKIVPMIHGEFVEKQSGTGFVHIAPAHGEVDFELCQEYDISLVESVDESGYYYDNVPVLGGRHIYAHEEQIFDALEGKLLAISTIEHEYPYDSRSGDVIIEGQMVTKGTPIIFRSTEQIFIDIKSIDFTQLEKDIMNLFTVPHTLKISMIETVKRRKEWCVSRNRVLGVPAVVFFEKETGKVLQNKKLYDLITNKIADNPAFFLKDASQDILKEVDLDPEDFDYFPFVLDVWFDSGCCAYLLSNYFGKPGQIDVADVYIEGKDQVRGWFQSSLLISYLLEEKLPYKAIVSHGFTVDEKGYKMSKSKGNVIDLQKTMEEFGAEIMMLWVINSDYTADVSIGPEILNKRSEMYRKIRNVMRYLLSVVENESIDKNFTEFSYLEQSIINECSEMQENFINYIKFGDNFNLKKAFDEFYLFLLRISEMYFNARKDAIYCDYESLERKSVIHCMWILLHNFNIILTIILPMTAEEIYDYIKSKNIANKYLKSIHQMHYDSLITIKFDAEIRTLEPIIEEFRKEIEQLKQNGSIKRNCDVMLFMNNDRMDIIGQILAVSQVKYAKENKVVVLDKDPCERCNIRSELKDNLCDRCYAILNP